MSSQNDRRFSDASAIDQTRPATATSDSAIDIGDGFDSGCGNRKRKRDEDTIEELLRDSFVVRPYPLKAPTKARTLHPLVLLLRAQLPLSYLDILSSSNPLPQSRLFETHVKILELEGRMGNEPMVLVARLDDERTLYAVEQEDRGLYAICKLGSWVNLQELRAVASASREGVSEVPENRFDFGAFTQTAPTHPTESDPSKFSKKKRLAIEAIQSMVKRPSTGLFSESQSNIPIEEEITVTPQPVEEHRGQPDSQFISGEPLAQPTASEIFDNIRTQYFDALYLSKASLAYFAKGPLSRARAAFHLDYDSTLEMNDLIAFLESLVLSISLIDKKYKDGLPNCLSMIDIEDHSANDAAKSKVKQKKNTKKMKPGKNGLYPLEDNSIRRWWASHEEDFEIGIPGKTREDLTKSRLAQLRIRETQLQMILILETLAMKPLASSVEDNSVGLPGDSKTIAGEKASKSRKSDQLLTLMDVHVDRLCIWQSISSESAKAMVGDAQVPEGTLKHSETITRDFCVDVIAPFFSSRLPDQCAAINRKLGGPVSISSPKPKLSRSTSASGSLSKPGAATKRPVPVKPRQSLSRVLTDERERERRSASAQPNRKLSLMRAATMPLMPCLKREGSEAPSLSGIPTAESQPVFATNKTGFTISKRFGHREADFGSLTRDIAAKTKKQSQIDNELKDAIAALKKPNRELAGKTFAETVEKRVVSNSHPRKSKKPTRNPLFQGVLISATPKTSRQVDVFSKAQTPGLSRLEQCEFDFIPPSSLPKVPQSSLPSQEKRSMRNPFLASAQATPTRKFISTLQTSRMELGPSPLDHKNHLPSSPMQARRSSASLFTSVPDSAIKESVVKSGTKSADFSILQETPAKKREKFSHAHHHPPRAMTLGSDKENGTGKDTVNKKLSVGVTRVDEDNIYKALGWDDVDEMDDLT